MRVANAFEIVLALAVFIIALRVMSQGLKGVLGQHMRRILTRLTAFTPLGVLTGAVATAMVQSSSAVAVMMVALVHARVLTLRQAFGVILGANIGTTITAQIISFDLVELSLPLMACGLLLLPLTQEMRNLGRALIGFGALFFGLHGLRLALIPMLASPLAQDVLVQLGASPLWGIGAGLALTAFVQSSSAVTGIVIALAQEGAITLGGAIAVALGCNIGTVTTTLMSSLGLDREALATAYADLLFNVVGVMLMLPLLPVFTGLVADTSPLLARQVANAHTLFNLGTALAALPCMGILTRIAARWAGIDEALAK